MKIKAIVAAFDIWYSQALTTVNPNDVIPAILLSPSAYSGPKEAGIYFFDLHPLNIG